MTEAIFALFVASGLCLTFSVITAIYAIRTLEKLRELIVEAWDLLLRYDAEDYRKEGTE